MEKCMISFLNKEVETTVRKEFDKINPRRNCIKKECNRFGRKLPKDIEVIDDSENNNPNVFGITEDMLPEKGKFKKILKYNSDGSADIFILSYDGALDQRSKKYENELKRITGLLENLECKDCKIINNFELYGEEICQKNNLSYCFIGLGEMMGGLVVTVMSSEGNIGRIDGKEIKTGRFENKNLTLKDLEDLEKKDFDVLINVFYDHPKMTFSI